MNGYELSLAFIKKNARSAGRVLAALSPEDAAEFLSGVPASVAATALSGINPQFAARIAQKMSAEKAATLIEELGFSRAAAMVRQIDSDSRKPMLDLLPRSIQRNFELALSFSIEMVGAHMTTSIVLMEPEDLVADALELLRRSKNERVTSVFVADPQHQMVGAVAIDNLLRFDTQSQLAELLDTSCVTLSAYANLESVSKLDIWNDYSQLPVVNRRRQLIGALDRKSLATEVSDSAEDERAESAGLTKSMTEAFSVSVGGLVNLLLPTESGLPSSGDDHDR